MCTFLGPKVKYAICDRTPPTCTPNVVYMSAQVFRDPKSSNRIQISWFVQFLLTFDWFQGSPLGGWKWVDGDGTLSGCLGGALHMCTCTHACTHVHARAYMYKHDNFMQMAAPIGKSWGIPLWHHRSHARVCMYMCTCVGHPPKHPERVPTPSPHLPPPRGDPRNQLKFDNTWTNQDISIPFENLKSVKNSHPRVGVCVLVGGWVVGVRSKH